MNPSHTVSRFLVDGIPIRGLQSVSWCECRLSWRSLTASGTVTADDVSCSAEGITFSADKRYVVEYAKET